MAIGVTQITHSTIFVVEGRDEEQFFEALLASIGLSNRAQIIEVEGVTNIRPYLKAIKNTPGFPSVKSLCVVRDADSNAAAALADVQNSLGGAGFSAPSVAYSLAAGNPMVSIAILPDGVNPGFLEDLCLQSVAADPIMLCVNAFGQCVTTLGFTPTQRSKALVQVYLTAKGRTALSVGRASATGYWQWTATAFSQLSTFLMQVVI